MARIFENFVELEVTDVQAATLVTAGMIYLDDDTTSEWFGWYRLSNEFIDTFEGSILEREKAAWEKIDAVLV